MSVARKIYDLIPPGQRLDALILLGIMLFVAVMQIGAVTSIMPFMAVVADPNIVERNAALGWVYQRSGLEERGFLILLGCLVLGMIVISNLARAAGVWATNRFVWSVNTRLSGALLDRYLHRPYLQFVSKGGAEAGKNVLVEVETFTRHFLQPVLEFVTKGITALLLVILIVLVDWKVSLVATLCFGGTYLLLYLFLRKRLERLGRRSVDLKSVRYKTVQEAFGAMKEAKAFGREGYFVEAYNAPTIRYGRAMVHFNLIKGLPNYLLEVIAFDALILIVIYFISTTDNFGQLVPILSLYGFAAYRLMPAIQGCFKAVSALRFTGYLVDKLHRDLMADTGDFGFWNNRKDSCEPTEDESRLRFEDRIELENVCFSYPAGERPAVNDISLTIPHRSMVAFCGPTGSGKTTLVDLILGLFLPESGRILVDGTPLTEGNISAWRRNIGYVPQSISLSDSSIAENIAFGLPRKKIDLETVKRAARMARVAEFIEKELPDGYDTLVGERGVRLSGGQRQRLGIARALYHDPGVLIFDEATSALDGATEREVMNAITETAKVKTVIMIAHRLSTVESCDRIFYVDRGELVEQGSYADLVKSNGAFREMAGR